MHSLAFLPPKLRDASLSRTDIVLAPAVAAEAIAELRDNGVAIEACEVVVDSRTGAAPRYKVERVQLYVREAGESWVTYVRRSAEIAFIFVNDTLSLAPPLTHTFIRITPRTRDPVARINVLTRQRQLPFSGRDVVISLLGVVTGGWYVVLAALPAAAIYHLAVFDDLVALTIYGGTILTVLYALVIVPLDEWNDVVFLAAAVVTLFLAPRLWYFALWRPRQAKSNIVARTLTLSCLGLPLISAFACGVAVALNH